MRYFIKLEVFLATAILYLFFWLVSLLPIKEFGWMVPMSEALKDFSMNDLVYSQFHPEMPPDTNIVIVNIGRIPRNEVAAVLRRVNAANPKVIGIDAFFRSEKDPALDTPLVNALKEAGRRVVLVDELWDAQEKGGKLVFGSMRTSHPKFNQWVQNGYANIGNDDNSPKTIRFISPWQKVGNDSIFSFSIQLLRNYRPDAARACLARGNSNEIINWRGNFGSFFFFDYNSLLDPQTDLSPLRGKIVLMALMEANVNNRTFEDMYFTPMNEQYAGKSFPDMYGIVIHANMISMVLSGDYIETLPAWVSTLFAVFLCYLNMVFFTYIHYRHGGWFDLLVFVSQTVVNLFFLYIAIMIFSSYRTQVDIGALLASFLLGPTVLEIFLPVWEKLEHRIKPWFSKPVSR